MAARHHSGSNAAACSGSARTPAPGWIVYAAFGLVALLAITLVFQYLYMPGMRGYFNNRSSPAFGSGTESPRAAVATAEAFRAAASRATGRATSRASTGSTVLIYFYMDGCPHCRDFEGDWQAFLLQNRDTLSAKGVVPRRLPSDSHEAREFKVTSFPTVLLVASGTAPVVFAGERSVAGLVSFVAGL
jgi:hypothetical protein